MGNQRSNENVLYKQIEEIQHKLDNKGHLLPQFQYDRLERKLDGLCEKLAIMQGESFFQEEE